MSNESFPDGAPKIEVPHVGEVLDETMKVIQNAEKLLEEYKTELQNLVAQNAPEEVINIQKSRIGDTEQGLDQLISARAQLLEASVGAEAIAAEVQDFKDQDKHKKGWIASQIFGGGGQSTDQVQ